MKTYRNPLAFAVVAMAITWGGMTMARGELVFDDDVNSNREAPAATAPKSEALAADSAAEKPRADADVNEKNISERKDLSKAEMMRRQRMREELKNEDLLTQKLEELRLKDETRRTNEILGSGIAKEADKPVLPPAAAQAPAAPATSAPLEEQRVGSSTAEHRQSLSEQPEAADGDSRIVNEMVSSDSLKSPDEALEEQTRVGITPRFGLSSMTNSIYDVQAKYSFGFDLTVDVTDYIAFTGGYTYSNYSVGAGNAFTYPMGFNQGALQRIDMNDNVISLGARAYVLNPRSKVRPFVGAGMAYRRGYVNFDDNTIRLIKAYSPYAAQDVEVSGFSGYIETGVEFKLTKSISINGMFRYFNVLSAKQNNPLDPSAFLTQSGYGYNGNYYGHYNYGYNSYGYSNDTRGQASDALSKNNFYQLMAGVTVTF